LDYATSVTRAQTETVLLFVIFALFIFALAALPAGLVLRNLNLFGSSAADGHDPALGISVLIPARNEQQGIAAAVESVVSNDLETLEVIVMDDHSSDDTAAIVREIGRRDSRVQLAEAPDLPAGWNGKQHACWQLSQLASHELLLFMDADVRLKPDALRRLAAQLQSTRADLLSGFPNQELGSLSEQLMIPMMYVVLLGYLPLDQMRASTKPEFGAGCGQLFLAKREPYNACKGHQAIQGSRHDGLKLPRAFRSAGFMSDLFDASDIATVRMYHNWPEVFRGLLKNADEGIANPKLIIVFTILLLGAAVWPILAFTHALYYAWPLTATVLLGAATVLSFVPRWLIAKRLRHSMLGVWLHPASVSLFVALQWIAFIRSLLGLKGIAWRGRT
jgi:glycosyltransferase involved in cell wall biosynthesis